MDPLVQKIYTGRTITTREITVLHVRAGTSAVLGVDIHAVTLQHRTTTTDELGGKPEITNKFKHGIQSTTDLAAIHARVEKNQHTLPYLETSKTPARQIQTPPNRWASVSDRGHIAAYHPDFLAAYLVNGPQWGILNHYDLKIRNPLKVALKGLPMILLEVQTNPRSVHFLDGTEVPTNVPNPMSNTPSLPWPRTQPTNKSGHVRSY